MAALNKANARANVAITIEGGAKKEVVDLSRALPAGFVPPPRTIKDIASVLDSEKPDPKSHAVMKAQADAEPTPGSPNSATFYYNRGKARLALGRADEALSDAQKAVQAAGDVHLAHLARQLIGIVKAHQGDPKGALQAFQDLHRTRNCAPPHRLDRELILEHHRDRHCGGRRSPGRGLSAAHECCDHRGAHQRPSGAAAELPTLRAVLGGRFRSLATAWAWHQQAHPYSDASLEA